MAEVHEDVMADEDVVLEEEYRAVREALRASFQANPTTKEKLSMIDEDLRCKKTSRKCKEQLETGRKESNDDVICIEEDDMISYEDSALKEPSRKGVESKSSERGTNGDVMYMVEDVMVSDEDYGVKDAMRRSIESTKRRKSNRDVVFVDENATNSDEDYSVKEAIRRSLAEQTFAKEKANEDIMHKEEDIVLSDERCGVETMRKSSEKPKSIIDLSYEDVMFVEGDIIDSDDDYVAQEALRRSLEEQNSTKEETNEDVLCMDLMDSDNDYDGYFLNKAKRKSSLKTGVKPQKIKAANENVMLLDEDDAELARRLQEEEDRKFVWSKKDQQSQLFTDETFARTLQQEFNNDSVLTGNKSPIPEESEVEENYDDLFPDVPPVRRRQGRNVAEVKPYTHPDGVNQTAREKELWRELQEYKLQGFKLASSPSTPRTSTPKSTCTPTSNRQRQPVKSPVKRTPVKQIPAKSTPARSTPVRSTPARSTPARSTPARSTPARSTPARSTPARTTPARNTPSKTGSAKYTAVKTTLVKIIPSKYTPARSTPVKIIAAKRIPPKRPSATYTPSSSTKKNIETVSCPPSKLRPQPSATFTPTSSATSTCLKLEFGQEGYPNDGLDLPSEECPMQRITCGNCGRVGHTRVFRLCPQYWTEAEIQHRQLLRTARRMKKIKKHEAHMRSYRVAQQARIVQQARRKPQQPRPEEEEWTPPARRLTPLSCRKMQLLKAMNKQKKK